jgi:hypothetical protein
MDPDTESLLVSTCMALGGFEDVSEDMNDSTQVYVMGDECLGKPLVFLLIRQTFPYIQILGSDQRERCMTLDLVSESHL